MSLARVTLSQVHRPISHGIGGTGTVAPPLRAPADHVAGGRGARLTVPDADHDLGPDRRPSSGFRLPADGRRLGPTFGDPVDDIALAHLAARRQRDFVKPEEVLRHVVS